jgi:hypothetical protein
MKLTTVFSAVNGNIRYYRFIPKQITFWAYFGIRFIAVFIGKKLPKELVPYSENIIIWSLNLDLNSAFVAQNMRIYYPALLELPDDELVMITDMDMLPANDNYYKNGLEKYNIDDFIYYRSIEGNQIYMCYNAAHPKTWAKVFGIYTIKDIESSINKTYTQDYSGVPGKKGWFIDQLTLYSKLIKYERLVVLQRPIKRLEVRIYHTHLANKDEHFINKYDDIHFHRNYNSNLRLILNAQKQIGQYRSERAIHEKCATNDCQFIVHSKFAIGRSIYCCRCCMKKPNRHGYFCERILNKIT